MIAVTIESGDESRTYSIHKHLLTHTFKDFSRKLDDVAETKSMTLRNVSFETMEAVSGWLYTRKLVVPNYKRAIKFPDEELDQATDDTNALAASKVQFNKNTSEKTTEGLEPVTESHDGFSEKAIPLLKWLIECAFDRWYQVFEQVADIFMFGTFYDSVDLRRNAILLVQRLMYTTQFRPNMILIAKLSDRLPLQSALCQLLVRICVSDMEVSAWEYWSVKALSRDFLVEVIRTLVKLRDEPEGIVHYDQNWCEFHEHVNEDERKACQSTRGNDANVCE